MPDYYAQCWASAWSLTREQIGQELRALYDPSGLPPRLATLARQLGTTAVDRHASNRQRRVNRATLLAHLAQVERHISDGGRHLSRQREIVAELERHGHGHSRTANLARDILASFEMGQSAHLNDRAHLLQALQR
jgi:hypothetical protein